MTQPIPDIGVRGIRQSIPSGYLLGRQSQGSGPVELIPVSSLSKGQGVSGTGGGGGSSTLAALTDVSVTEGAGIDGYVLYWNNAGPKWEAEALAASALIDTTNASNISSGTLATARLSTSMQTAAIIAVFDGNGAAPPASSTFDLYVPFACTIQSVTLQADQSGSAVIDIWKAAYPSVPVLGNSITAAAQPTLSATDHNQDTTLTGWTKSISAGDWLRFNVNSASTLTRVCLTLKVVRS